MTAILANGDYPKIDGIARPMLKNAERIIACDGAADWLFNELLRKPDLVVGDLDSVKNTYKNTIRIDGQNDNDLAKAIRVCRKYGFKDLRIFGATGKREDHTLGNIFIAMEEFIPVITDYGYFLPILGKHRIKVGKGTAVSVFATNPRTRMVSKGLEWPLDDVRFVNLYCATLNRAKSQFITISTSHPAFIYVEHNF